MAKVTGGGDQLKAICAKQREVFGLALGYVGELKDRPTTIVEGVMTELLARVPDLLDAETRKLVADAQVRVNALLKLPAAGSGSGSGSGSGVAP
jgi:hypothetical protein